jgi:peptidoglycan/xylan/chitin deacetylase (PgdA/CDA1 family)
MGKFEIENIPQRRQVIDYLLAQLKYLPVDERQSKVDVLCKIVPVSLPRNLMMTSHQVRVLHNAGMEIGGHTANHPILARISNSTARTEILLGKEALEDIIRAPVRLFAYPNGKPGQDYLMDHVRTVRDLGFTAAVSTAHGAGKSDSDVYQLPRFTPWSRGLARFTLQMARNLVIKPQAL